MEECNRDHLILVATSGFSCKTLLFSLPCIFALSIHVLVTQNVYLYFSWCILKLPFAMTLQHVNLNSNFCCSLLTI